MVFVSVVVFVFVIVFVVVVVVVHPRNLPLPEFGKPFLYNTCTPLSKKAKYFLKS